MFEYDNKKLVLKCKEMIKCDVAKISKIGGTLFLIIGFNSNTKDDPGQWVQIFDDSTQENRDWDYINEHCSIRQY